MHFRNYFLFLKNRNLKFKFFFILIIFFSLTIFLLDSFSIFTLLPIISNISLSESSNYTNYSQYIPDYLINFIVDLDVKKLFLLLIIIFFLRNIFYIFYNFIIYNFSKFLEIDTSKKVFFLSISKSFLNFYEQNSAEIIKDLRDSVVAYVIFIESLIRIITEIIIITLFIIFLFYISQKETTYIVTYFLFIFIIFSRLTSKISSIYGKEANLSANRINFTIINAYKNFAQIILRQLKDRYMKIFTNNIIQFSISRYFINFIKSNTRPMLEISILLFILLFFYFQRSFYSQAEIFMLIGIYLVAGYRILPMINSLTGYFIRLKNFEFAYNIINEKINLFNKKYNQINYKTKKKSTFKFKRSLELKNVSFKYKVSENNYLFKNLRLKIEKNEMIGIYGQSGHGKSTIAKIILGLIKPIGGHISLDRKKINYKQIDQYQSLFGYLPQENLFIPDTIKENIAFGEEEINEKKLIEALKKSNCLEFVNKLKNKTNHKLTEDGKNFSTGQLQRLALARTIYFDNEIIVLDEPTSSLDPQAENKFIKLVNSLKKYKTIIIISHKNKTLKNCNKVFELKNKKLSRRKLNN